MAQRKNGQTKTPQVKAGQNTSSSAGKRQGQGAKAARSASPEAPAIQSKPAAKSAGQNSKSSGAVKARAQQAARPAGANTRGQRSERKAEVNSQPQRSESKKKSGLFKFRRYKKVEGGEKKKAKHPKLIVEQNKNTVGFMGLTESPKRGHHKNIELDDNPEKGNTDKAYVRKEIRYADLGEFGEILKNYNLSERDKQKIVEYLEKLKKK